jgi:hypothetical protein
MKKILCLMLAFLFLAGCGSKPAPEWISASFNQIERYKMHYMRGPESLAEQSFQRALEEIKSSGDIEIMATAYLIKYAVQTAALEAFDDREYLKLEAIRPTRPYVHYYSFLKGSFTKVDVNELPGQYRHFLRAMQIGNQVDIEREVHRIDDPLSRLVAAGLIVRDGQASEALLNGAVETASRQGWKKPLLAYLKKLELFYDSGKDLKKAAEVRKRLELINQ